MTPLLSVLKGERQMPPPLWLMRQAGRYLPEYREKRSEAGDFLTLCYTPDFAAEVTLQPIRRFGFDAAILFSDILVVPDALGQQVWFEPGEGPRLQPIRSLGDLPDTTEDDIVDHLSPMFRTLEQVRQSLAGEIALIGFCGAPWTVASYMIAGQGTKDLEPIRSLARQDPQILSEIIDRLVNVSIAYLSRQVEAGADVLQIFESWAQVLRGVDFERWSLAPIRRIVAGVKARHPKTPVIVFPRKAERDGYLEIARTDDISAVSVDPDIDLEWVADTLQPHAAIQGNLDPEILMAGGTDIDVALDRMAATIGQGCWIANLGHGILPTTPIAHVEHLVSRVRSLGD